MSRSLEKNKCALPSSSLSEHSGVFVCSLLRGESSSSDSISKVPRLGRASREHMLGWCGWFFARGRVSRAMSWLSRERSVWLRKPWKHTFAFFQVRTVRQLPGPRRVVSQFQLCPYCASCRLLFFWPKPFASLSAWPCKEKPGKYCFGFVPKTSMRADGYPLHSLRVHAVVME